MQLVKLCCLGCWGWRALWSAPLPLPSGVGERARKGLKKGDQLRRTKFFVAAHMRLQESGSSYAAVETNCGRRGEVSDCAAVEKKSSVMAISSVHFTSGIPFLLGRGNANTPPPFVSRSLPRASFMYLG
ncbi:hypothetical protein B0H63DRAFT_279644 [Podospora didyma]|uniref:Secreted protein n=1 Tax=Podospora didyma TaxID=330526 RepID=A0AAE0KFA0_9PEZI|nr:hypothetical protein B0H63DRAFT_279644 [Podospora didyma]